MLGVGALAAVLSFLVVMTAHPQRDRAIDATERRHAGASPVSCTAPDLERARLMRKMMGLINQMRGLVSEFGIILPEGIGHLYRRVPDILADADHALPGSMRDVAVA